ncbi:hypothetical protein ACFP51_02520 [Streptomyces pratens]|uniref:Uncharacterized protein n=1 Tax=Streptomyces pratens TaxID=887456 RepID=A0ABW1M3X4_9ACTN
MQDLIRRIGHGVSLFLGPGTGTRRAGGPRYSRCGPSRRPAASAGLPLLHSPYCRHLPLDGAGSRLLRPCLVAGFGINLDQHIVGVWKVAA